ncbi:MAG: hypothetical protein HKN68_02500 [Saprospiraceae bacterium]|nr:hypothetical protein [Saprospiraceae bacterium]
MNGELKKVSDRTFGFYPEETLDYGQQYILKVELPSGIGKLEIPFETRELEMSMNIKNQFIYTQDGASIKGTLTTSDWVESSFIEPIFASIEGNENISWAHSSNGRVHDFQIEGIERKSSSYDYTINWDHPDLGVKGEKTFQIQPVGAFSYVDLEISRSSRAVTIFFSDLLKTDQRLEGLISIPGQEIGNIRIDGSKVTVYLQQTFQDSKTLIISKNIKNQSGKSLSKDIKMPIQFDPVKPELKLVGNGVITPFQENVFFPFEAIGLYAVDVEIFKVYENNVLQYLQNNRLNDRSYYLEQVGRIIHQEKVEILPPDDAMVDEWNRYTIDLKRLTEMEPGAIYVVRVGFRRDYTNYPCEDGVSDGPLIVEPENPTSIMRWNYNYDGYRYSQEGSPCYPVYYNENRFIQRNLLASNLGIVAKLGDDDRLSVYVKDINNLTPISGAEVSIYDYQKQRLIQYSTDGEGHLSAELERKPSFVVVKHGQEYGYLNIRDQYANSLSDFDIGGSKKKDGIDAFIYGERGVWRPGDTIYLSIMNDDNNRTFPEDHPITLRVKDARGKIAYRKTTTDGIGGIYTFMIPTGSEDITGVWNAEVKIGNQSFYKSLRIETIKPNRLKIELDIPDDPVIANGLAIPMTASWLHGARGAGLRAEVETSYSGINPQFNNYNSYIFNDPARRINTASQSVFKGKLNEEGKTTLDIRKGDDFLPPGKVRMRLKSKVYEPSGEYSEDNISFSADPYTHYVGIKSPETRWGYNYLPREKDAPLSIVSLDQTGNPVAGKKINIGVYEAEWQWWYSRSSSNIYRYDASNHLGAVEKKTLTTDSKGMISWRPESLDNYRYLVRACDEESGHCTGILLYTSYYSDQTNDGGANILSLTSDKESYEVGEEMKIQIPSNESSEIYISVENGVSVLNELWVKGENQSTEVVIPVETTMTPNVYIHAMLIQKGRGTETDLPLRMYGVLPVSIDDADKKLSPEIVVAEKIKPKQKYKVTVSEEDDKEMYYTLAVVDEGLLNLTRFRTPSPGNHFFAKQSLGVKTWDMYDMVTQGYGDRVERFISIGGDADVGSEPGDKKANRFKPVVDFLGPFHLKKGASKEHTLHMDNYMGEVRVMVVARSDNAFGEAQKSIQVTNPVIVLPTFPRVISPNTSVALPISVFATEDRVKEVIVELELGPGLSTIDARNKRIQFTRSGDQLVSYPINIGKYSGHSYAKVIARYDGNSIDQTINFNIENANPITHDIVDFTLNAGESMDLAYEPYGLTGTHDATIEISTFPAINLEERLSYLIRYPYGCVEQTTSSVFPQIFLDDIIALSQDDKNKVKKNIQKGISRLISFQLANGGLSYWKGGREVSEWGTSYAGHFMLAAKEKGYYVPDYFWDNWLKYQKSEATYFRDRGSERAGLMQAYRLYTLARYGDPDWAAMNYLRNEKMSSTATFVLAAAYASASKPDIARTLIAGKKMDVEEYNEMSYTYGSALRDKALIAEAMMTNGVDDNTRSLIREIATDLGENRWYSTQTTSFALMAVGNYLSQVEIGELKGSLSIPGGETVQINSEQPVYQFTVPNPEVASSLTLTNQSNGELFIRLIKSGKLPYGTSSDVASNLKLNVNYRDLNGKSIDINNIEQGKDFIAELSVSNPGTRSQTLEEMALTYVVPSGWEIVNDRISGNTSTIKSDQYDHIDIRDDRVNYFFDLRGSKIFRVRLTATYEGRYYLPDTYCSAMYDQKVSAIKSGQWVEVNRRMDVQ